MIQVIKIWLISSLMVALLYYLFVYRLSGEHKLCEGITLKENQEKNYSLNFDEDRQLIHVNGPMEIGILHEFKKLLTKHPQSSGVVFNSDGGNIYQARGLAKIILANALNTYIFEICYSACAIPYVAGKVRYLGHNGKLGFHQYNMDSKFANPFIDIEKEQNKDLLFFKTRIPDNNFIDNIFNSECTDIWIPDNKVLLDAGVIHVTLAEIE